MPLFVHGIVEVISWSQSSNYIICLCSGVVKFRGKNSVFFFPHPTHRYSTARLDHLIHIGRNSSLVFLNLCSPFNLLQGYFFLACHLGSSGTISLSIFISSGEDQSPTGFLKCGLCRLKFIERETCFFNQLL